MAAFTGMAEFCVRFLACNLVIAVMTALFLAAKRLLLRVLSGRMQYNLWLVFLALLAVPFLPVGGAVRFPGFAANSAGKLSSAAFRAAAGTEAQRTADWLHDFYEAAGSGASALAGRVLTALWLLGMAAGLALTASSLLRLLRLKRSALPLQSDQVRRIYERCLRETGIRREIPIYSTAFLASPVIAGCFRPRIYLPIRLISDFHGERLRYMLLHELEHYRHRDTLVGGLMHLAGIVYWFNPLVRRALREMVDDREVACDAAVLRRLSAGEYRAYGMTLIDLAESVSRNPVPLAAGIGGSMRQMKRRIRSIASYRPFTPDRRRRGLAACAAVAMLLVSFAPPLAIFAADTDRYRWEAPENLAVREELGSHFDGSPGCFVLYDREADAWTVCGLERASVRVSPNSTYKIYDALLGLESGVIGPGRSQMAWDGTNYSIDAWNAGQDLNSAMKNSVNWYFQSIDRQAGEEKVREFVDRIGYGNRDLSGEFPSYWMESSLKISPVEQVELLQKFDQNRFGLPGEQVQAVKNALLLESAGGARLYGKTGTGQVGSGDRNGWFVGYVEKPGNTCYFAAYICGGGDTGGTRAAGAAMGILADLGVWN